MADATYGLLVRRAEGRGWKGTRATRVTADEVRRAFYEVTKGELGDVQPEQALVGCVEVLRGRGVLRPMHATDREKVAIPKGFHLAPVREAAEREIPAMPIWHRDLYDLADHWEAANPLRRARYLAVNRWLKSGADQMRVPVRERCLDVFAVFGGPACHPDAEKTLDTRTTAALFGDENRLMEILRTYRVPPPLLSETVVEGTDSGYQRVGPGDVLLVLENSTTWWSIVEALPDPGQHRVGYVAWGLGASFTRSVQSISERHRITEIRYVGDLDLSGVRIPAQAAAVARQRDLPPVVPATCLYRALLALGHPAPSREPSARERAGPHLEWLMPEFHTAVVDLLEAGARLAQEWVGLRYLTTSNEWYEDLR